MSNKHKLIGNYPNWKQVFSLSSGVLLLWLNNLVLLEDGIWAQVNHSRDTNPSFHTAQRAIPNFSPETETTETSETQEPNNEFIFPLPNQESTQEIQISQPTEQLVPPPSVPSTIERREQLPQPQPQPRGYNPPTYENLPTSEFTPYRLGIGDGISLSVQRFPEFNAQSSISPEGNVVIPILGRISLIGLTIAEAEEKISLELQRRFLQDKPEVIVQAVALRPVQITIAGEVFRPGFYQLPPGANLSTALLSAGGSTTYADLRSIIVRRSLIDGTIIEQKVNLLEPIQNGESLPNLRLQDGDAIIISQIQVGDNQDYNSILASRSTLAQPQIRVRVLSYAGAGLGTVPLANGSTFLDALTAISPSLVDANLGEIGLVRFDREKGKAVSQNLDGKAVLEGDLSQNVPLQDNDVIIIGRNLIAKITFALGRFTQPFRDILGFLLFFDQIGDSATDLFE